MMINPPQSSEFHMVVNVHYTLKVLAEHLFTVAYTTQTKYNALKNIPMHGVLSGISYMEGLITGFRAHAYFLI